MPDEFDARRRRWLIGAALPLAARLAGGAWAAPAPEEPAPTFLDDLSHRTFNWFWETTPANGLVRDRWPSQDVCSIAAVGFGLTAYGIGAERGYITRAQAAERVLTTVRFFRDAPQGPEPAGMAGHHGFFYHFLDAKSGARHKDSEISTVDTALLLAGMLFCASYFDRDDASEAGIRRAVDEVSARVDWPWSQPRAPAICHGWTPEAGFIKYDWKGYNEAMIVYLLALGAPQRAVGADAWAAWTSTYGDFWGTLWGQEHLTFAPLFGHQYTHTWIDFRGIRDAYMRGRGLDYFENSRRATYAQRAYAIANPMRWKEYGENVWGFTACDGPEPADHMYLGESRRFHGYSARGVGLHRVEDDGTIAPTAAGGSIAFAPEIAIPAIEEMYRRFGVQVFGKYGFVDSFNTSFDYEDARVHWGKRVPGFGWVDTDSLGIDQGPILAMMENHASGLVWRTMRRNASIRRGLQRAGFTGGWLEGGANGA
ncbi:MAG: glucoamylase family protein [Usitatibacter sp.]